MFYRKKRFPDFVIIGAQKAGTTSLYQYLTQHPQIDAATQKEVHYFDLNFEKPLEWYRSFFPSLLVDNYNLTGESSPYYIFHPTAPKRIYKTMPKTKIIILLRNPIDRAYSHYHHAKRNLGETLSFEEAINYEGERLEGESDKLIEDPYYKSKNYQNYSYLKRGKYVEQLKVWFKLFPNKQILVLNFEEFFSNLPNSMEQVTSFLRISKYDFRCKPYNVGEYEEIEKDTREKLKIFFEPYNQELFKFLGRSFDWK